jgi:hypothetical protein
LLSWSEGARYTDTTIDTQERIYHIEKQTFLKKEKYAQPR